MHNTHTLYLYNILILICAKTLDKYPISDTISIAIKTKHKKIALQVHEHLKQGEPPKPNNNNRGSNIIPRCPTNEKGNIMITAKLLQQRIDRLNQEDGRQPGQPLEYILNQSNGGYRVCIADNIHGGIQDLSSRGTARETAIWLDGFVAARLMAMEVSQC